MTDDIPSYVTAEQRERILASRSALERIVAQAREQLAAPTPAPPTNGGVPSPTYEEQEQDCETCHRPFRAKVCNFGGLRIVTRNCQPCCDDYERRNNPDPATVQEMREAAWADLCPAEYQDTDEAKVRLSAGDKVVNEVLGWDCSRGLGLVGSTGRCKTRLMFLLLRVRHMAGAKIRYVNAVNFADELADAYGRGSDDAERWMKSIERAPLLFIDDLGKEKTTERVLTFYYRMTEHRTSNRLPLFFTSNLTGAPLQKRWDEAAHRGGFFADHASAIIRRLKERCKSISL